MNLDAIRLQPNARYVAEGKMVHPSGGSWSINHDIRLQTDEHAKVVRFDDRWTQDVSMADIWDYLKLRNETTGESFDLRLHTAAASGNVGMAKEALAESADVNLRMKQGATPLHWASAMGRFDIANLLVAHHADVNLVDELGWMPIFLADANGHPQIVELLQKHGAKLEAVIQGKPAKITMERDWNEVILDAAESGNLPEVKAALENGADVNGLREDGWSVLLCAAKGSPAILELLLANGADPNIASHRGYTPLMRAAGNGCVEAVNLLLAAGADIDMRDCDGKTAAQLAREMDEYECADLVSTVVPQGENQRAESPSDSKTDMVQISIYEMEAEFLKTKRVRALFTACRPAHGPIHLIDFKFENGIELINVRVEDEELVTIPSDYVSMPVETASIPVRERQQALAPMSAKRKDGTVIF